MKESTKRTTKLKRILTFPLRMLGKARDLYVDAMNSYADTACYASAGFGSSAADPLPRSFSATSHRARDADFSDLVRAASSRAYSDKLDLSAIHQSTGDSKGFMAKIDEDKPCEIPDLKEIEGDDGKKQSEKAAGSGLLGKSRSYGGSSRKRFDRRNWE